MATIDLGPCGCCGDGAAFLCCYEVTLLSCSEQDEDGNWQSVPCPSCGDQGFTAAEGGTYIECYEWSVGNCGWDGSFSVSCEDAKQGYYIDNAYASNLYLKKSACPSSAALGQDVTC